MDQIETIGKLRPTKSKHGQIEATEYLRTQFTSPADKAYAFGYDPKRNDKDQLKRYS